MKPTSTGAVSHLAWRQISCGFATFIFFAGYSCNNSGFDEKEESIEPLKRGKVSVGKKFV